MAKTGAIHWGSALLWLVVFVALFVAHQRLAPYACDDAYIHMRVAEHLMKFGRPDFNPGERLMVSSSTPWMLLLTLLGFVGGLTTSVIAGVNALALTLCGSVTYRIARMLELSKPAQVLAAALVIAALFVSSAELMETPVAILCALLAVDAAMRHRALSGGVWLGLASALRVECLVVVAVLLFATWRQKPFPWVKFLPGLLLLFGGFQFLNFYWYGTAVPHGALAKSVVYQAPPEAVLLNFIQSVYGASLLGRSLDLIRSHLVLIFGCVVYGVLRVSNQLTRTKRFAAAALVVGLVTLSLYVMKGVPLFEWYVPLYLVPIVLAVVALTDGLGRVKGGALAVLITLPIFLGGLRDIYAGLVSPSMFSGFEKGARVQAYLRLGEDLNERFPDAELLTAEIGGLGFTFRGRVIDGVGIASPEALPFHPLSVPDERRNHLIGAIPSELIAQTKPKLIVSFPQYLSQQQPGDLFSGYAAEEHPGYLTAEGELLGERSRSTLLVYVRNDADGAPTD